ncbi:hypothetical protein R9C00_07660 [Flammeovirgaceae bacterium SG7u.111]|nr:hypothetical protein [Flammeovirgaceae bacterium SG7u.132]WPO37322.1 hypothetical protein R9C00_07660 [Flammeovirgaceae bacterium SG7u.111]
MKKFVSIILLTLSMMYGLSLSSCNSSGSYGLGCVSGIVQGTNVRVYIACMTRTEYLQSDNVFFGRQYDNLLFTEIEDTCNECSQIDYSKL